MYKTDKHPKEAVAGQISSPWRDEMVDVGEYSLNMHCTGDPTDRPVVVDSSGYSSTSLNWALVLPEVAESTRVCAYDRPGSGFSFVNPDPHTYQQEAEELHTLLRVNSLPVYLYNLTKCLRKSGLAPSCYNQ